VFATHPVHVEAVACIVGRAELLCAVVYCAAILCYCAFLRQLYGGTVKPGGKLAYGWFAAALLLAVVAVFSKENGITLVGVFLMLELLYGRPSETATASTGLLSDVQWVVSGIRPGFGARLSTLVAWTTVVMTYRISVHNGAKMYAWRVLENQMAHMPPVRPCCAHPLHVARPCNVSVLVRVRESTARSPLCTLMRCTSNSCCGLDVSE
jgi:hypothetical protein